MADLRYALFLGCTIPYRELSYEVSARRVAAALGIELVDMPDANCCGLPLEPANHALMVRLAARNLCIAEEMELDVLSLCNGCTGVLRKVNRSLKADRGERAAINADLGKIGKEFHGTIAVHHLVHVLLNAVGLDALKAAITTPLTGLRIAPFHGCHIFRPSAIMDVDPEDPQLLHDLIAVTGATSVHYVDELQCCGASCAGIDSQVPLHLSREKYHSVAAQDVDAMVTICPSCHVVLDANQPMTQRTFSERYGVPVLHYPQLLGLAMGMSPETLALDALRIKATAVLETVAAL